MKIQLIVFDLDKTLWDHEDASTLEPPYKRIGEDSIVDSHGRTLSLYPNVRNILKELKSRGLLLAIASWNLERVGEILRILDIAKYFDVICIEPHPDKAKMLRKILMELRKTRV